MNVRFYNAKILRLKDDSKHEFECIDGELWVKGTEICYIGDGKDVSSVCKGDDVIIWDREIDASGKLLMSGFKNAHTHTAMTFLRSFADDL
ncbi:MAG: amidohydrolase, partial [Lachnospiraceae bacterium]|nr:amidohydrolase [Lachnospiraceae bacterium]